MPTTRKAVQSVVTRRQLRVSGRKDMLYRSTKRTDAKLTIESQVLPVLMTTCFSLHLNKWFHVDRTISVPAMVTARKGYNSLPFNPYVSFLLDYIKIFNLTHSQRCCTE